MYKILIVFVFLLGLGKAEWIQLNNSSERLAITVEEETDNYIHSYWTYAFIIQTENYDKDWFKFRDIFKKNGGDHFYAAWKLSYDEPLFKNSIQSKSYIWQKYISGLCPNAEFLQPRMIQLKTNYWDLKKAEKQAAILQKKSRRI